VNYFRQRRISLWLKIIINVFKLQIMKKKLMVLSGFVLGLTPVVALADAASDAARVAFCTTGTLGAIMCKLSQLITGIVPILVALGVVYFVFGVITYVISNDEDAKTKGRDRIIYGIIGLAVIVSVWALVTVLTTTFGVGTSTDITLPGIPSL
jgi:hypothetical protein